MLIRNQTNVVRCEYEPALHRSQGELDLDQEGEFLSEGLGLVRELHSAKRHNASGGFLRHNGRPAKVRLAQRDPVEIEVLSALLCQLAREAQICLH